MLSEEDPTQNASQNRKTFLRAMVKWPLQIENTIISKHCF